MCCFYIYESTWEGELVKGKMIINKHKHKERKNIFTLSTKAEENLVEGKKIKKILECECVWIFE